ncbi:Lysozyme inhibitor LprI N-terminal domain-containing protein [uncultured Thiomicrorhabdus sp.]
MKTMTLKALVISAAVAGSANVQAADDVYGQCLADARTIVETTVKDGSTAAKALEQKTTVEQCFAELDKIEAKYGDKTRAVNPSSVMSAEDKLKWAKLFNAIDAKKFTGQEYRFAAYYRSMPHMSF